MGGRLPFSRVFVDIHPFFAKRTETKRRRKGKREKGKGKEKEKEKEKSGKTLRS